MATVAPPAEVGEAAYARGLDVVDDNPFPPGTHDFNEWVRGWEEARDSDQRGASDYVNDRDEPGFP